MTINDLVNSKDYVCMFYSRKTKKWKIVCTNSYQRMLRLNEDPNNVNFSLYVKYACIK